MYPRNSGLTSSLARATALGSLYRAVVNSGQRKPLPGSFQTPTRSDSRLAPPDD